MENHKRILGILFVVAASLQILVVSALALFITAIFSFVMRKAEPADAEILDLIMNVARFIPAFVIIFISLPSLLAGIGLLAKQKWALILALIMGCLKLFSFPFGTALGIYTIWVYSEDQRLAAQK